MTQPNPKTMSIEKALSFIHENPDSADFVGPILEAQIQKTEAFLNLTFPPTYRKFVSELGCGDILGLELFGIVSNTELMGTGIPCVTWLTTNLRNEELPQHFIPIADVGDGQYYVIDTQNHNRSQTDTCPVLIWDPATLETTPEFENFGTFLWEVIGELG